MTGAEREEEQAVRIVFVCTGNRARSVLAAALLRRETTGLPLHVESRGTLDLGESGPLPNAVAAGRRLGLDLSAHTARPLARGELAGADLVLGFEPSHVAAAVVDGGAARGRAFTLPELLELALPPGPIAQVGERVAILAAGAHARRRGSPFSAPTIHDPLGGTPDVFHRTAVEIEGLVTRLAQLIQPSVDATREPPPSDSSRQSVIHDG
jgi:protein-tyrosine-phosphatase